MRPTVLSPKNIPLLISEAKKRRCLWDTSHPQHGDIIHMGTAWNEISEKLNVPVTTLKVKWKNLRDSLKKIMKMSKNNKTPYKGRWPYYKSLKFLRLSMRQEHDIKYEIELEDDEDEEIQIGDDGGEANSDNRYNERMDDDSDYEKADSNEGDENEQNELEEDFVISNISSIPSIQIEGNAKEREDDEYDLMFLESLAPFFSQLDPTRKLILRSRIQDMLLNEVIAKKNGQSSLP